MELTYTERNGVMYPDLALPEQTNYLIGKCVKWLFSFCLKNFGANCAEAGVKNIYRLRTNFAFSCRI